MSALKGFSKKESPKKTATSQDLPSGKKAKGERVSPFREWMDAILVAFLLAMFIRVFVVELFMIPSPSMTPTLIGVEPPRQAIIYEDMNKDGQDDLILKSDQSFHVYLRDGKVYRYAGEHNPGYEYESWMQKGRRKQQDKILVGKFLYWFSPPRRGDIVVFKVPQSIFEREKPIYIKRVVGLPGETLSFEAAPGVPGHENTMGWLVVDGKRVVEPEFFKNQRYEYRNIRGIDPYLLPDYSKQRFSGFGMDLESVKVPEKAVYVFGDNTVSSRDSRYWGHVDFAHLRGKAILRYWPLNVFGFLQ